VPGRVIETSPTEFKLLRYLMLNPNRVLSKTQILDHVWDYDFRGEAGHRRVLHLLPASQDRHRRACRPLIHTKRGRRLRCACGSSPSS
jgi:two-component system OmpR family response regulator